MSETFEKNERPLRHHFFDLVEDWKWMWIRHAFNGNGVALFDSFSDYSVPLFLKVALMKDLNKSSEPANRESPMGSLLCVYKVS